MPTGALFADDGFALILVSSYDIELPIHHFFVAFDGAVHRLSAVELVVYRLAVV